MAYTVVNMKSEFNEFWTLANGKDFPIQLALWDKIVESKHRSRKKTSVPVRKVSGHWSEDFG